MSVSTQTEILVCASFYCLAALLYQRYPIGFSRFVLTAAVGYFVGQVLFRHELTFQRVELAVER